MRGMREIREEFNRRPALFWESDPVGFHNIIEANVHGALPDASKSRCGTPYRQACVS